MMKKHIRPYIGILIRHLIGTSLSILTIRFYGLITGTDFVEHITHIFLELSMLIFWTFPFILINSILILLTFSATKKYNFIVSLCIRFLVVGLMGWMGAYIIVNNIIGWSLIFMYLTLTAGVFVGAFGNIFQLKNKKIILNLCMSAFIILFFSGAFILHSFIRENILIVGHNTVIGLKKIEKQFNNDEDLKKHYCPDSGANRIGSEYLNSLCYPDNLQMFIDLYNSKGIVLEPFMELKNPWQIRRKDVVFLVFPDTFRYLPFGRIWHHVNIPKRGSVIYFHNEKHSYSYANSDENPWSFFPENTEFSKKQIVIRKENYNLCISMDTLQRFASCFVNYFKFPKNDKVFPKNK